jgi:hypothetical protein
MFVTLRFGDRVYLENGRVRNDSPPPTTVWQKVTTMSNQTGWVKADYIAPDSGDANRGGGD